MGASRFQGAQNNFQYRFSLLEYLVVPEPQHSKSLRFNLTIATFVIPMTLLVLAAIKLNDEFRV